MTKLSEYWNKFVIWLFGIAPHHLIDLKEELEVATEIDSTKDIHQILLEDEFKGYFGLLKVKSSSLSELSIVEKIQRDMYDILREVYEE